MISLTNRKREPDKRPHYIHDRTSVNTERVTPGSNTQKRARREKSKVQNQLIILMEKLWPFMQEMRGVRDESRDESEGWARRKSHLQSQPDYIFTQ